jgi:hypothetical protein
MGVTQVVECLPTKHKSSNPSNTKKALLSQITSHFLHLSTLPTKYFFFKL